MTQADLQALRNPLLVLVALLVVAAATVYYSDQVMDSTDRQLEQQQAQLKQARTRLQKSGDEQDVIVRYLDGFRRLQRSGFVGDEQRINWLDGLRLANQQADLFGVDYQVSVQRPLPYAAEFNPGQIALNQSVMRLRFRLLHEEDLMRFFNALVRQGAGIFAVDQCVLRRLDTGGVIRYQPNLSADCELSWITAKVGSGAEQKKP
jgi:primosomal replication protein N